MVRPRIVAALVVAAAALCAVPVARAAGEAIRVPAARRAFYVGAAVNMDALRTEPVYRETLGREFNICVAENVFKFSLIHPRPGEYDFSKTDELAAFARSRNMKLRGHTLVWYQQLPTWVANGKFTRDEAIALLRDHITTVVTRYKDAVWAWDVVNEAISDSGGTPRTESFWYKSIGPDYIAMAFRFAREADPDAILYYNDYNAEGGGAKSDAVYALVSDLKSQGVPIDGVGWQMHVVNGHEMTEAHRANARRLAALGLELSITELDVRIQLPVTAAALALQADTYRAITAFCLAEPAFKALVMWGFTDKHSWVPGFFKGYGSALLFDENYRAKPAYAAFRAALAAGAGDGPIVSGLDVKGNNLTVTGGGFARGADVVVAGSSPKTKFKSATRVIGKRVAQTLAAGDEVVVRNPDGSQSPAFTYYPFPSETSLAESALLQD